jgi:hypothetical protein
VAKVAYQDIGELGEVSAAGIGKAIIVPAKEALRQVRFALGGNLTIRDNSYAAIVTLGYTGNSTQTLTHATEYTFQNPLKTTPIGFTPIKATDASGTAIAIPQCTFNTGRTDGLMGITPLFDNSTSSTGYAGEQVSSFVPSASAVNMPGTPGVVDITTIELTTGKWLVDFVVFINLGTATSPTVTRAWINTASGTDPGTTANGNTRLVTNLVPSANGGAILAMPGIPVTVTAAEQDYYLTSGMTYSVGTPTTYGRITATRVVPYLTGYSGIVTGILWGG